ncbi:MAG: histidine phosphatase family protein [Holosporaceae bacterium]|nr:histidine phosphatase family protein [Holosporaceae bacterium]
MKHMRKKWSECSLLSEEMFRCCCDRGRYSCCSMLSLVLFISALLLANCATKSNPLNLVSASQHAAGINVNCCKLSEIPRGVEVHPPFPIKIATAADKVGSYTTFLLMRHAPTKNNHKVHGSKLDSEILTTPSKERDDFIKLKNSVNFSQLYTAESRRARSTADLISGPKYTKTWLFNEQKLGRLEGMEKDKAMKTEMFKNMFHSIDYRLPSWKDTGVAETGREVTERMLFGFSKVAAENVGKIVGICTSQSSMIWAYRYLSSNPDVFIKVENYHIIIFRYYNKTHAVELLTRDGPVSPSAALKICENFCQTEQPN